MAPDIDDRLAEALLDYEARQQPSAVTQAAANSETFPAELLGRLERDKACIDLLREMREEFTAERCRNKSTHAPAARRAAESAGGVRHIGRFQILETLGAGGFGIVYRAYDSRTKRDVALKIPRFEALASPELMQRFEHEAWAAARLNHDNIVAVLEAGSDGVLPYIASVYYPGDTLATWLKQQPEPVAPRAAAAFMQRLADGVAHAHQQGVQHRDIKPSNVLLVAKDAAIAVQSLEDATPKLMDFGLAKVASEEHDLTRSGAILGTVRYMSPEQAAGRTKLIGPASDVYSLGAVLYELLVGQPPFAATSDVEVLRRIQDEEPSRIRKQRRAIPRDLETICLKCLEKDPGRRYPAVAALADDLGRYLAGAPIAARPSTAVNRASKWIKRYPAWASFFFVLGLSSLLIITGLIASNRTIRAERDRTAASERQSREYAYSADMRLAQEAWDRSTPEEALALLKRYIPSDGDEDLRGIEWHYLWNNAHHHSKVIATQPSPIYSLAVSPDETIFATGGHDGKLRVWSLSEQRLLRELPGDAKGDVDTILFSPDGKQLYCAGDDHKIHVWDTVLWQRITSLEGHDNWIGAMALDRSGRWLAAGDADGRVVLWDIQQRRIEHEMYRHKGAVKCVLFHPTKPWVASFCDGNEGHIWNYVQNCPPDEIPDGRLESPQGNPWHAAFHPKGRWLFGSCDGRLVSWDLHSSSPGKLSSNRISPWGEAIAMSPSGAFVFSGGGNNAYPDIFVRPFNHMEELTHRLHGHSRVVRALAPLSDSKTLLSGAEDGTVRAWQYRLSDPANSSHYVGDTVDALAWSPKKDVLIIGLHHGGVLVSDDGLRTDPNPLGQHNNGLRAFAFAADGQRFISIDWTGEARWGDVEHGLGQPAYRIDEDVEQACLDPTDRTLFYSESTRLVAVDAGSGAELWQFEHPEHVTAIDVTADRILTACNDGRLRVFAAATGKIIHESPSGHGQLRSMNRSMDGRKLALTFQDKTVRILNAGNLTEERSFPCTEALRSYFVDDGRRLLVIDERDLSLLHAGSGQRLLKWNEHVDGWVTAMNKDRTVLAARGLQNHVAIVRLKVE